MKDIPDQSIDMILCDPPYGTTACKWDSVIPFDPMWAELKRVIKANGAIVLHGSQPFTSALIMSNIKMFKYCWVWEKSVAFGFVHAKNQPMKKHEDIMVFSAAPMGHKSLLGNKRMEFYPYDAVFKGNEAVVGKKPNSLGQRPNQDGNKYRPMTGFPTSVLKYKNDKGLHPTQKPVALSEHLIKTYTNSTETVLDFTMGSGTTGAACINTDRKFIGIELDKTYFDTACRRIQSMFDQKNAQNSPILTEAL